jgi:S1-C subfamily serine protease
MSEDRRTEKGLRKEAGVPKDRAGSCRVGPEASSGVELLGAYSQAVITVADAVGPAVVGIIAGQDGRGKPGEPVGPGSGIIIAPDGYVLTNDHVVQNAKNITVILSDGATLEAVLIGTDPATDLAVLRAEGSGLPYAGMGDSAQLRVG